MSNKTQKNRGGRSSAPTKPLPKPPRRRDRTSGQVSLKTATQSSSASPNRDPTRVLTAQLTDQESAIASYLTALAVPGYPARVPLMLGEFENITNTYEYQFNGTSVAGAAGCAYVCAAPDGWQESGNDAGPVEQQLSYAAGTQGYPVWGSISNASNTPAAGAASGANDGKYQFGAALDPGFDATIQYRLVALILEMWPDSSGQTTQGDITVAAVSTEEAMLDGALNGANFASIAAYPREYVNHQEFALANWQSGHVAAVNMVPWGVSCVRMNYLPGAGMATAARFGVAAVAAGCASGQTFRWRITYKYETTAPRTYITNVISTPTSLVESSRVAPHLAAMSKISPVKGPRTHMAARPLVAMKQAEPGLFQKLIKMGKDSGLGKVVAAGLKSVPLVGNLLSAGADWLFG